MMSVVHSPVMTKMHGLVKDMTGYEKDGLRVLGRAGSDKNRRAMWECQCPCGMVFVARGAQIREGDVATCGCHVTEVHSVRAEPTYWRAHGRLRKHRGPAGKHDCVDCGERAYDWSYKGGAPDEMTGGQRKNQSFRFSYMHEYYEPRCRACHRKYDGRAGTCL